MHCLSSLGCAFIHPFRDRRRASIERRRCKNPHGIMPKLFCLQNDYGHYFRKTAIPQAIFMQGPHSDMLLGEIVNPNSREGGIPSLSLFLKIPKLVGARWEWEPDVLKGYSGKCVRIKTFFPAPSQRAHSWSSSFHRSVPKDLRLTLHLSLFMEGFQQTKWTKSFSGFPE